MIGYHCPNTDLRDERGFCSSEERSDDWLHWKPDWPFEDRISEDLASIGC